MPFIADPGNPAARARRGAAPAITLGVGLGAFLDGIVLHQILQWHHLVVEYRTADDLAGLQYNTFWDGIFHLVTWVVVLAGLLGLWQRRGAARAFGAVTLIGMLLIGWGAFNIADQLVFHMALGAHHIRMVEDYQVYDWAYTMVGVVLVVVGLLLVRSNGRARS